MKRRQPINHLFAMFGRCTCNHSVSLQQSVIGLSHSFTHCWCIARSYKLLAMDCQLQLQEYLRQNLIIIMLPPPMISFFLSFSKIEIHGKWELPLSHRAKFIQHVGSFTMYTGYTAEGIDCMQAWLLRLLAPILSAILSHLFNQHHHHHLRLFEKITRTPRRMRTQEDHYIPKQWKIAKLRPVPKNNPTTPGEYIPISVVVFLSMILERFVVKSFLYPAFESPDFSDNVSSVLQDLLLQPL